MNHKPGSYRNVFWFRRSSCAGLVWVLLVAVSIVFTGCRKKGTQGSGTVAAKEKTGASFLISGDTKGWIVPCGCTTKQSGGLLRRGTMVRDMRAKQGQTYVLDAGGAAAGHSDYHRTKLEAILQGEIRMGLCAHNIGASEAAFGPKAISEIEAKFETPFVSTNIHDAEGNLIASPVRYAQNSDLGHRFAIFGVLDPKYQVDGLLIGDPHQAILDQIEKLENDVDGMIVLAYLPREALFELAKQLPEVDAIIGGPTGQTIQPTKMGATLVASSTNKGKFVVQLVVDPARQWTADVVEVDESHADDKEQVANLSAYHDELARKDYSSDATGLTDQIRIHTGSTDAFAGNATCQKCHVDDCSHYTSTKHAIAWKTLEDKRSHVDPYCQQCHTTGYGSDKGFVSVRQSPALFNVGCESCHGPSSAHVADVKKRTTFNAKDQCLQCHDRENSPLFKYDEYWTKIIHGTKVGMTDKEVKQ